MFVTATGTVTRKSMELGWVGVVRLGFKWQSVLSTEILDFDKDSKMIYAMDAIPTQVSKLSGSLA